MFYPDNTAQPLSLLKNKYPALFRSGHLGFTLIELMVVIAIIGTLAGIALPNYIAYRERAIMTRVITELRIIDREILVFEADRGRFPLTLAEIGLDTFTDPWGNPYAYLNHSTVSGLGQKRSKNGTVPVNTDFDLYSMGKDGDTRRPFTARQSRDDIVRCNNGAYFGLASEY